MLLKSINKPLNICLFSRVNYWQGIRGGMDFHGKLLSEELVKLGHSVACISSRHSRGIIRERRNGVTFHYLPKTDFGSRRHGWPQESVKKYIELNKQRKFDLIWSQSFDAFGFAIQGKRVSHPPIIATLHGSVVQESQTFFRNIQNMRKMPGIFVRELAGLFFAYFISQKPLLSIADRVICVSQTVSRDIGRWYGKRYLEKCETVENGIDVNFFNKNKEKRRLIRNRYGIPIGHFLILTLGRMTHEKGHHLALYALKKLCDRKINASLLIAGEGEYLENLMNISEKIGIKNRVRFTGPLSHDEVVDYYNAADIFVMPTLTIEGLPFVLLEAMACGTPVIASRIGGNCFIDHGENGFLFETGNVDAMVENIESLINHKDKQNTLSTKGRKTIVEKYNVKKMVEKTQTVMLETVLQHQCKVAKVLIS